PPGVGVRLRDQLVEQLQEQQAGLPLAFDVDEPARPRVPRTGEIAFRVASGRQHLLLSAAPHPVRSDLGVEVDVDLVDVDGDLGGGRVHPQPLDLPQPPPPPRRLPGAFDADYRGPKLTYNPNAPAPIPWPRGSVPRR